MGILLSCAGLALFTITGFVYHLTGEQETLYVSGLFLVPTLQLLSFHALDEKSKLRTLSFWIVGTSGLLHAVSWWVYSRLVTSMGSHPLIGRAADYLRNLDFAWSFVLVTFAFYLTVLIVGHSNIPIEASGWKARVAKALDRWNVELRATIKKHSVFSICLIFTIFLHVTYALGFSLALHDKREHGFYVNPVPWTRPVGSLQLRDPVSGEDPDNIHLFHDLRKAVDGGDHSTVRIVVGGAVSTRVSGEGEGRRREYSPHGVEAAISTLGRQLGVNGRVEWLFETSPEPEEDGFGSGAALPFHVPPGASLPVVAVVHRSAADTELIDYVNFIVYTMVTTGYGDLVPISPFSKTVCSFANIFELFFTVILFAVFLAFVGPWGSPEVLNKEAAEGVHTGTTPESENGR